MVCFKVYESRYNREDINYVNDCSILLSCSSQGKRHLCVKEYSPLPELFYQ